MFVAADVVINMVDVAQSAEHLVVVQGVAGSSPVFHPKAKTLHVAGFLCIWMFGLV